MTVHRLVWKAATPTPTPEEGVRGVQYLFDDESHEIVEQEVVDYEHNVRQVLHQESLPADCVPDDVQQSLWELGFWRLRIAP